MYELSLVELERELAAELPTRNLLMCRHSVRRVVRKPVSHGGGTSANANSTDQLNSNPQTVVNTGMQEQPVKGLSADPKTVAPGPGIDIHSYNDNHNHNTQTATPLNFGLGN